MRIIQLKKIVTGIVVLIAVSIDAIRRRNSKA